MEQVNEYLKQIVTDNQKLIKEMKTQNENHNRQFGVLFSGLNTVNSRVDQLEVSNCSRLVQIIGVPVIQNETTASLLDILKKLCTAIKVTCSEKEIDDIHRSGKDKKNIKVEFTTKIKRREIVKAARAYKIVGNDIGMESSDRLFVNEYLSHQSNVLHREARELRREGQLEYVWIDNGRILAKEKEGMKAVLVLSQEDLIKFRKS